MEKLECYCGQIVDLDFPSDYDLDQDTESAEAILDGTFMNLSCPGCGKTLKPELPVRVRQPSAEFDVFLIPELDRGAYQAARLDYDLPSAPRVAIGYPELVEKLRISRAGLDDRAVEVLKYYLLSRALEGSPGSNPSVRFREITGGSTAIVLEIEGIRDDQIGLTQVPMETYRRTVERLDEITTEDPFDEILAPPHVSITSLSEK